VLLALGPVAWYQSTVASVYPLFLAAIALLVNAADAWERRPTPPRLALLAGAIGLVAVSHKTGIAFAVAAIAFVLVVGRRSLLAPRNLAALAVLLAPLAAVAYLPLRESYGGFPNLRADAHASVLDWITGSVGAPDAEPLGGNLYAIRIHAGRLALLLVASLSPAVVLAPLGAWSLRRRRAFVWCCLAPALAVSAAVATTPGGYAYWHLPLILAGTIATGAGAARLIERVRHRRTRRIAVGVALAAAAVFVGAVGGGYLARSHRDASPWARATLSALSQGEQIRAPWAAYTVLAATQELEHRRRDVRVTIADAVNGAPDLRRLAGTAFVDMSAPHGPPDPPAGFAIAPAGPATGANDKGLSGLDLGPVRIGLPRARARAYEVSFPLSAGARARRTRRSRP
jgi:hypothetical protein